MGRELLERERPKVKTLAMDKTYEGRQDAFACGEYRHENERAAEIESKEEAEIRQEELQKTQ